MKMPRVPSTLTELDEYFKANGLQMVVNRFQYHVDERIRGERVEVTIEGSGFKVDELHNLTPKEDEKNFNKILREAIENG